jgi:hypothetical protein
MNIRIGENFISKQNLYYEDGVTPFPVSLIKRLKGVLVQNEVNVKEYIYPNILKKGDTNYQVKIEISKQVSSKLQIGTLYMDLYLEYINSELELDPTQLIIQRVAIAEVR